MTMAYKVLQQPINIASTSLLSFFCKYHPKPLHLLIIAMLYMLYINYSILQQEDDMDLSLKAQKFLVNSPHCRIPHIEPNSSSMLRYFRRQSFRSCSQQPPITYVRFDAYKQRYRIFIRQSYLRCCYKNVLRDARSELADSRVQLSSCKPFKNGTLLLPQLEHILVQCFSAYKRVYVGAHAMVPTRQQIEQRLSARSAFAANTTSPFSLLIIGIDSVSRLHYHRSLPRTANYLTNSGWLELLGYNKMGDNTFPNLMAMLTGLSEQQAFAQCDPFKLQGLDNCSFIWKQFRDRGYITALSEDTPEIATFNYLKLGFKQPPVDYYARPLMLAAARNIKSSLGGLCWGELSQSDLVYSYALEFATRYLHQPYFGFFWTNSFSHDDYNQLSSMDDYMQHFFEQLAHLQILNNTVVLFLSDHGVRFGANRRTLSGFYEGRLPLLKIWLPQRFRNSFPEYVHNLQQNRYRLSTPYDLHMTLQHLLTLTADSGSKQNKMLALAAGCPACQSLFLPLPNDRACHEAGVPPDFCACGLYGRMPLNDANATMIAQKAISYMNRRVQKLDKLEQCRTLRLARIVAVYFQHEQNELPKYYIHFLTYPNQGLYEVIAKYNESESAFPVTDVTRLNSYKFDSHCVDDWYIKVFCSCAKQLGYF